VYYLFSLALCVALVQSSIAQSVYPAIGARTHAMGYSATCSRDGWSVFNNPAGMAGFTAVETGAGVERVTGFPSFERISAFAIVPWKLGATAIGASRFGDDLYNEQLITFGYANRFGLASLGAAVRYIRVNTEGFGGKSVASVSTGGVAELTPWLLAGAKITNIIQPKLAEGERLPTMMSAAIAVTHREKFVATLEIEKDLDYEPVIKAGTEYIFNKKFAVRSGFNLNPAAIFGGFGISRSRFTVDYAFCWNTEWPVVHGLSVGFQFIRKERP